MGVNSPQHVVVAVNPFASFGKHGAVGVDVARELERAGYRVTVLQETSFASLQRSVQAALQPTTGALIVVGGDGMASLGVNALAETNIPLGIVATGTGNDFARGLGLPINEPTTGIGVLINRLTQKPSSVDLAKVTTPGGETRWYAGVLSAGFDALVNERANSMRWPKGAFRYVLALLLELAKLRSRRYLLTIDGVKREVDAVLVSIANNGYMGGGMHVAPAAVLDDGELDVFIGHKLSRRRLLAVFPKVYAGTHTKHPAVEFIRARAITLQAEDVLAYADGERISRLPVDVRVVPGALQVFGAPAKG